METSLPQGAGIRAQGPPRPPALSPRLFLTSASFLSRSPCLDWAADWAALNVTCVHSTEAHGDFGAPLTSFSAVLLPSSHDGGYRETERDCSDLRDGRASSSESQTGMVVLRSPFSYISVPTTSFAVFHFLFIAFSLLFLSSFSESRAKCY